MSAPEETPIVPAPAVEEPPPLVAHRRALEALLRDGAAFVVLDPEAGDWREGAVELQQPNRVWSCLPIPIPEALEAVRLLTPNDQLRDVLTVVLAVGRLPSAAVVANLEGQLGVEVVAVSPDGLRSGPRARQGSGPALEAALGRADPPVDVDAAYAEGRVAGEELAFEHHLQQQAQVPWVTQVLVGICILVWLLQIGTGTSATQPSVHVLRAWGASAPDLVLSEPWRLITAGFLHGGIAHLGLNMWILWTFGPFCERLFGRAGYLTIFLAAVAGGFLASTAFNPPLFAAVGASGGILGLVGAVLGFALLRRDVIPKGIAVRLAKGIGTFLALNGVLWLALGAVFPIDHAGHGGGFLIGFLGGVGLARPMPPPERESPRRVLAALALAIALVVSWGVVRDRPAVIWKASQLRLSVYNPQFQQFDEICAEVVRLNKNRRQHSTAEIRERADALRLRVAKLREQRIGIPEPLTGLEEVRLRFDEALAALEGYLAHEVAGDDAIVEAAAEFVAARGRFFDQLEKVGKKP